jgi:hypothetical protein
LDPLEGVFLSDAPAVLLMDNCSTHFGAETIRLLTDRNVKVITFPPHTSGIFQMLDLVFFGVFKQVKCDVRIISDRLFSDPPFFLFSSL